jgi:hypothetical protein
MTEKERAEYIADAWKKMQEYTAYMEARVPPATPGLKRMGAYAHTEPDEHFGRKGSIARLRRKK